MSNFKKYLLLSLIAAFFNAAVLLVFFVPRFNHTDTQQYVSTIKYVLGEEGGEVFPARILKPLPILIAALLNPVLSPKNALIAQNVIFYFLSAWLIFLLIYRIYRNEKQAFYGVILYIGAYPMLAYGLASLTDISGWFFYILSVLIALNFLEKPVLKTAFLSGLVAGFGMLFKENSAAAPIFFASLMFIAVKVPFKEKLKYLLTFGAAFAIFPAISSVFIYKLYSYSYLDWFGVSKVSAGGGALYVISPLRILIEAGRVFLIGWIFVLLGAIKEFTQKNIGRIKVLLAFIPSSLSFFVWIYPHNRMMYIAAPLLVFVASFGILRENKNQKLGRILEIIFLMAYVSISYFVLDFLLKYGTIIQPPGTYFG
jgi:hypothetical protein